MALEITKNIDIIKNITVDFYDNKYIMINAKQYDDVSRLIAITCYNQGKIFNLNADRHSVYVRYGKADGHSVLDFCNISNGKVLLELTEQMLASSGVCDVELVVINKGEAIVDVNTGEIKAIDSTSILSTMTFHINVYESTVDSSVIESSDEFNLFNNRLENYWADFEKVVKTSKSWAVGDTGVVGRSETEDTDNSKYYSQLSKSYAIGDLDGETGTKNRENEGTDNAEYYSRLAKSYTMGSFDGSTGTRNDETSENAKTYMETTKSHMDDARSYMEITEGYMNNTNQYMDTAKSHMDDTKSYMDATNEYMNTTESYMDTTNGYMGTTKSHMDDTKTYMETANGYMNNTESYMNNANEYMTATNQYMNTTKSYMDNANEYMSNAKTSETNAKVSENNSKASENASATSEANAKTSEINAKKSETNASTSETNAKTSETNALNSATNAQSYTIGGTGTRENEDVDNARYYYGEIVRIYNEIISIVDNINSPAAVDEVKDYLGI